MWVSVDGLWGIFCGIVICVQFSGKLVNIIEIHVLVKSKWDTNGKPNQTKPNIRCFTKLVDKVTIWACCIRGQRGIAAKAICEKCFNWFYWILKLTAEWLKGYLLQTILFRFSFKLVWLRSGGIRRVSGFCFCIYFFSNSAAYFRVLKGCWIAESKFKKHGFLSF